MSKVLEISACVLYFAGVCCVLISTALLYDETTTEKPRISEPTPPPSVARFVGGTRVGAIRGDEAVAMCSSEDAGVPTGIHCWTEPIEGDVGWMVSCAAICKGAP